MAGCWRKVRFSRFFDHKSAAVFALASMSLISGTARAQLEYGPSELHREQWDIDHDPWQAIPDPTGHAVERICSTGEGILHVTEYAPVTDPQTGKSGGYAHPRQVVKVYADKNAVAHKKCSVEWVDGSAHGVGWMALKALEPVRYRPRAKAQGTN